MWYHIIYLFRFHIMLGKNSFYMVYPVPDNVLLQLTNILFPHKDSTLFNLFRSIFFPAFQTSIRL